MQARGFDMAGYITPGTVIERVYFAVPVHGTIGHTFETHVDALVYAIAEAQVAEERDHGYDFKAKPVVDVRWVLRVGNATGGTDTVAERFHYDSIADAEAHRDRFNTFANVR